MTDEQIKQRITQILQILHDPKIGFNGLFNDVKEEYLAELRKKIDRNKEPERYVAERDKLFAELRPALEPGKRKKVKEMAIALNPAMADATYDEQKFALTGESIMKNRLYVSCGNAAKAFCYVDQHLSDYIPGSQNGLLDTQIMFSTDPERLIDGMSGHTLPCVKMSDGKYHALDPQIPVDKENPQLPFIQDEIVVGGNINHILPSIAKNGRPYKIMKIVTPKELETTYLDFGKFLEATTSRTGKTGVICKSLSATLKKLNLKQYRKMGAAKLVYEFSKAYQDLPDDLDVLVYSDKENNIVPFFRAQLNGQWYNVRMDADYLSLNRHDTVQELDYDGRKLHLIKQLSPSEYIKEYDNYIQQQIMVEQSAQKE